MSKKEKQNAVTVIGGVEPSLKNLVLIEHFALRMFECDRADIILGLDLGYALAHDPSEYSEGMGSAQLLDIARTKAGRSKLTGSQRCCVIGQIPHGANDLDQYRRQVQEVRDWGLFNKSIFFANFMHSPRAKLELVDL